MLFLHIFRIFLMLKITVVLNISYYVYILVFICRCYTGSEKNGFYGPMNPTKKRVYAFLQARVFTKFHHISSSLENAALIRTAKMPRLYNIADFFCKFLTYNESKFLFVYRDNPTYSLGFL
jgi:hypothetical protein